MSVPPQILRIKRKAEDSPVDALYIEEANKRRAISEHGFVFRRLIPKINRNHALSSLSDSSNPPSAVSSLSPGNLRSNGIPQVMATRPGDERTMFSRDSKQSPNHEQGALSGASQTARRFYLSNVADLVAASFSAKEPTPSTPRNGTRRIEENNGPIALFVEEHTAKEAMPSCAAEEIGASDHTGMSYTAGTQFWRKDFTLPLRKRPGATAAVLKDTTATPPRSISSVENGTSGMELQDALQKYAMEEFGTSTHYEAVTRGAEHTYIGQAPQYSFQSGVDEMEGIEYIYDTYVRQPTDNITMATKASASMDTYAGSLVSGPTNSIGYLVIPETSSSVFFHTFDSDDEDEKKAGDWDSEEDDENNENYYTADYPEEEDRDDDGEVWSNDERDDGDYQGESWKWEMKKREWGWEDDRARGRKTVHGEDEDEDEDGEDE